VADSTQLGEAIIQLTFPLRDPLEQGMHHLSPLSRPFAGPVANLPSLPVLSPSMASQLCPTAIIALTDYRGHGGIWDTFTAHRYDACIALAGSFPILVKLTNLSYFAKTVDEDVWERTILSQSEARKDILRESLVLHGPLRALQGTCIPRHVGLWGSVQPPRGQGPDEDRHEREVWCEVLEDVGFSLEEGAKAIPAVK
jgi:hypothetical protein